MRENPAQRLHDLLEDLRAQPGNISIRAAWANVFRVDTDNHELFFRAVAEFTALPDATFRQLLHLEVPHDLYVTPWLLPVNAVVDGFNSMGNGVESVHRQYDGAVLLGLRHASNVLAVGRGAEQDDVDSLLQAIHDMESAAREADDVDVEVRAFILRHLREMEVALMLFKVGGVDAFERTLTSTVGELVMRNVEGKPVPDPKTPLGKRFATLLTHAGLFVAFGNGAIELGGTIVEGAKALGP